MSKQELIDKAIKQIEADVAFNDFTAIEELLDHVPENILKGFIGEDA